MEKITKKMFNRSGKPLSDFVLKIFAVIIALIIWFVLSITQYPTINKTVTGVPVDFNMSGTTAESKGLSALNYQDISVDVEIQGMNYEIGTYSASDLTATVNLDSVTSEGTYELSIDVKSAHTADRCTVVSVTPETVEVQFDRINTTYVPLSLSASRVSAADGYTLKESALSESEIEISGPENELDKVAKAVAVFTDSITISEDTTLSTDNIQLYDADDNLLDDENITFSKSSVDVNFVVYRKVNVTMTPYYSDVPPGFDTSSLPYGISPDVLQIITPQLDGSSEEELSLGPISLYSIADEDTFSFDIAPLLATGEINQTGEETITITFDLSDYGRKEFQLQTSSIEILGAPDGKSITFDAEQISGVVITGPSDVIDNLKKSDLTAQIDLSDISANGSFSVEVTIYSEKYNTIWNIGSHETEITISDYTEDDSSEG